MNMDMEMTPDLTTPLPVEAPFELVGTPLAGGLLIIADHASAHVPADVDLGIDPALLSNHIAVDIGVAPVARRIVEQLGCAAFLGGQSRLVVDLNREAHEPAVIPIASDGHAIAGNALDHEAREARLARFYHPYHDRLAALLSDFRPALILSLHSFTPSLSSHPDEARPWDIGVLYNRHEAASKIGIALLEEAGLNVGDQLPYSGRLLNATMNRHAEGNDIPYIGVEMRQDHVGNDAGQARFAHILADMAQKIAERLA